MPEVRALQQAHAIEQAAMWRLRLRLSAGRDLFEAERVADLLVDAERRRRDVAALLQAHGAGPSLRLVLRALAQGASAEADEPASPHAAGRGGGARDLPAVRMGAAEEGGLVVMRWAELADAYRRRAAGRAIRRLRRRSRPLPVAAPASPAGRFDAWPADVVLKTCPADPEAAARRAHAAAIRAAGRPLLLDVVDPATEAAAVTAAIDVGAAGALVRTGDAAADEVLARAARDAERVRLLDAPMISVVVCARDGADVLPACLSSLARVAYPRFEVVVCDDGSTDATGRIAAAAGVRLLTLEPGGLSRARNAGIAAARGSVVAFLDADAEATPGWLEHLWRAIERTGAAGAGGPNVPVPGVGWQERVVSGAPGPAIPAVNSDGSCLLVVGCNMAFRRDALLDVGGFSEELLSSGDDVDVCRRLAERGHRLAFAPNAVVLHHRRDSIAGFLRQQRGYRRSLGGLGAPPATLQRRLLRAVLRRPRHLFRGPQARQLYAVTNRPLDEGLALRSTAGLAALSAIVAARRARTGHGRAWAAGAAAVNAAWIAGLAARVPAHEPPRGAGGALQRLATLGLWLVYPFVRSPRH